MTKAQAKYRGALAKRATPAAPARHAGIYPPDVHDHATDALKALSGIIDVAHAANGLAELNSDESISDALEHALHLTKLIKSDVDSLWQAYQAVKGASHQGSRFTCRRTQMDIGEIEKIGIRRIPKHTPPVTAPIPAPQPEKRETAPAPQREPVPA